MDLNNKVNNVVQFYSNCSFLKHKPKIDVIYMSKLHFILF